MKLAVISVLSAVAFLSDGNVISEAFPLDITEDLNLFQDSTGEGLTDNIVAPGPGPGPGPGVSKIIMVADADLLSTLKALGRNMPERILSPEHRDGSPDQSSISIIRRDTKRCMVGRVYRPCWEA